ncbi:hypothetical protein NC796_15825 [Aliifodinibius sp. S!AR15-10]|uniref:tetratricopeptide repeat protein n=1 Tax=Aliifodinibius sp. S!AR15-10 TaxID=2950437 RepID=UPI00286028F3|nr:hypothetical protein [Aliifodinibius sp. S!AR15-10]MDR8392625.1 hypothetical protein [Aliifodinibius sp. S!AR15-10]
MGGDSKYQKRIALAVLPFENLTPGEEADIFCRSFSIDLITELSRFRQFEIIAFDSVKDLRPDTKDWQTFFDDLHTDYFVSGTFRTDKEKIRINVRLLESDTHRLVWADRFEEEAGQLMELQEKLLRKVVAMLQEQMNYDLISQIPKKQKTDLKAYECWLYGIEEVKKGTVESDLKAREFFQQALEIDPNYSLAYSGMSLTYFNEWSCQLWDRWELSQNGAFEWAKKAIELDEQNYVAAYILGRVFLYQHAFETAEHYLRKSLRLNSNDSLSLVRIALCFNYLGYHKEAFQLYERALRLNPVASEIYHPAGAVILFELGRFKEALELANRSDSIPFADYKAYCAAAWYELGNQEKMKECLNEFLDEYNRLINRGKNATIQEAIEWMSAVNPYRNQTRLENFWTYLTDGEFELKKHEAPVLTEDQPQSIKEGPDFWEFTYGGKTVQLVAVKGFVNLKMLMQNIRTPVHCCELMGTAVLSKGERVLDEQAKSEYRQKISTLQNEIEEAENHQDFEKAGKLQEEYEQLVEHLSKSLGLDGSPRVKGDTVERARSAVTWRIRSAIAKIEKEHPVLGKHLSNSIKTGTFCSYEPEQEEHWEVYN